MPRSLITSTLAKPAATLTGTEVVRLITDPAGTPTNSKTTLNAISAFVALSLSLGVTVTYPNQTDFAGSLAIGGGLTNIVEAGATAFDGDGLTAFGVDALKDVTTGYHSTAVGTRAMESSLTGHSMIAIGYEAVRDDTDPNYSVVIGNSSYLTASNVAQVVAVGYQNFYSCTTGGAQSASVGIYCGFSNTTGTRNTYMGGYAGYRPNAQDCVAIGCNAHYGASVGVVSTGDVSIGYQAGYSMGTHTGYNTNIGWRAGYDLTTGSYNINIGAGPSTLGTCVQSGVYNIMIGAGVRHGVAQAGNYQLNIGNLLFGTNTNTQDTLATTGKIGIGTAAPGARLHVFGDVSTAAGQLSLEGGGTYGPVLIQDNTGSNGATVFMVPTDDNWATVGANKWIMGHGAAATGTVDICLDSTGQFGIGTYAPTALLDVASDVIRLRTSKTPATAAATGNAGDHCWDSTHFFICVATDTWKRAAIATW